MKFVLEELVLWLKNGKIRRLEFKNNKINVITGDSGTGKSAIINIIDYCFFASKANISEEKINENVSWYGLKFKINNKSFTIARGALTEKGKVSDLYYYSPIGVVPEEISDTIEEKQLKEIIENEFSIDSNVIIPYGGKKLKAGSKISLRYFWLFNTQSENTICNSEVFFDKQNDEKYNEALHRVFDLATGIDTVKNIIIKEKINALEKDLNRLEKRKAALKKEENIFHSNIKELIRKAKEYDLIKDVTKNIEEDVFYLKELVKTIKDADFSSDYKEFDKLQKQKFEVKRKIRNFTRFRSEYEKYTKIQKDNLDSLQPLNFIKEKYGSLIINRDLIDLMEMFENELGLIKKEIKNKSPFNINIDEQLKNLQKELSLIEDALDRFPNIKSDFQNHIHKFVFIGEIKSKLEMFEKKFTDIFNEEEFDNKARELAELQDKLEKEIINRDLVYKLLEELIQNYLDDSGDALGTYKGYKSVFDYKNKVLKLKKPGAVNTAVVGSSSNHMFLHLCFMLGLHELIISQEVPFVPSFIILDQPSRPYYGEDAGSKKNKKNWSQIPQDDKTKITIAFKILNDFIDKINSDYKTDFQIIVLEHIPPSIWEDEKLNNVILVDEEFKHGNALIPDSYIN
ncbi:DUF3732 domain-containing protein [Heliobacterium chlorum]|uniref:DUF3732 domain-containing protein n=1 Tax=Heliobacterium chlorum TaxID=2698 RepID=A0ABR7T7F9_HELCL|nr:DUF3732 domain-containing protein [Heliobacterium chlorum]MBC9785948.1 DUF3732 domain-containing protein [Heliobacterium chlorum]